MAARQVVSDERSLKKLAPSWWPFFCPKKTFLIQYIDVSEGALEEDRSERYQCVQTQKIPQVLSMILHDPKKRS